MGAHRPPPHAHVNSSLFSRGASLAELDERARDIFRRIVETYLETGEPVGSRTLSKSGLLEVGDVGEQERQSIEARLRAHGRNFDEALNEASAILSGLAGAASVVVTPIRDAGVKHVEFVSLGPERTLAIMVFEDGTVENRLIRLPAGVTPSALQEASNFLNARLRGRTLVEARADLSSELDRARRELDETAARLVEDGLAAWSGNEADRALIVRGRANLLGEPQALEDLERVRSLFEDLEQKEQLIHLLDGVREGHGVRIFIGAETRLFSLSGSAVIAAPYMTGTQRVLGAIGVIGPARLNYARVIPLVDYTARVLGQVMNA
jgi:heat-inducible transcriptional repressor